MPPQQKSGLPRKSLPVFQPPRTVGAKSSVLERKHGTDTSTSLKSIAADDDDDNFFHGAVGKLSVPCSIKRELRPHQVQGVTFLWNALNGHSKIEQVSPHCDSDLVYRGCILSDEMGLGKTLMTIGTICALQKQDRNSRFVVVCPSSLVKNWAREFDKWIGIAGQPKRIIVRGGTDGVAQMKAFNVLKPNSQSEVLIISYELFRLNVELLKNIKKVSLLVVDEAHRLKNTNGSLTMSALESMPCGARLCLTATPIQNSLADAYSIVNFVCPGVLGDLATFRKDYERPISALNSRSCISAQTQRGTKASQVLDRIIKCIMLRRLQKDILENYLPPRSEFLLFCQPTREQCDLYRRVTAQYKGMDASDHGPSPEALTALITLRKVCSHPQLVEQDIAYNQRKATVFDIGVSGKLVVLEALLQQIRNLEPMDKVVIVSNFTTTLELVENAILKPSENMRFLRLDGTTPSANRQSIVDTFNRTSATTTFALTLSSKAGGVGLNLIGSNRLILVDPDWNPSTDIQAMARIYREGQKKPCFIYRLFTSGSVEEVIYQRQLKKEGLSALVVDKDEPLKGKASHSLSAEELRDCFTLKECACDTSIKVGNWPDYNGVDSLQNCHDKALVAVASSDNFITSLAFVHTVGETTHKPRKKRAEVVVERQGDESSDEEFEFVD
jgi:SNF2 family DNA or RNA helicase